MLKVLLPVGLLAVLGALWLRREVRRTDAMLEAWRNGRDARREEWFI